MRNGILGAPGKRIGVAMGIMPGCVGDRFLYGDNVSNLCFKITHAHHKNKNMYIL